MENIIMNENFEELNNDQDLIEDLEIFNSIKDRLNATKTDFISFEEVLSKLGMNISETQKSI